MLFSAGGRQDIDAWNVTLTLTLAVFNYLSVNSYPFLRPESLALCFVVLLPLVFLALMAGRFAWFWMFYAGLIFFMVDAATGFVEHLKSWGGWPGVWAATVAIFAAVYFIRKKIRNIFMAGIAASLAGAILFHWAAPTRLFTSYEAPGQRESALGGGNIYFFILDEHIGLAGLPDGKELERVYRDGGFSIYPRAYSNYDSTLDAIPSYLNARIFPERRSGLRKKSLRANRLFEKWSGEGRRLHVYQSTHLDFRHAEKAHPKKVFTYRESSMGYIRDLPIAWHAKLRALFNNFIEDSRSLTVRKIRRLLEPGRFIRGSVTSGVLATGPILEEIEKDTLRHPAGSVFFAHFLAPHASYFYDVDCAFLDPARWESCHYDELDGQGTLNREEDRRRRYALYRNQIRCLHAKLFNFFDFLRREGLYEQSTIFIVSDHGSRIYRLDMKAKYSLRLLPEDYRDGFSAFLAFKNGGASPRFTVNEGRSVLDKTPIVSLVGLFFGLMDEDGAKDPALSKIYVETDDFSAFQAVDYPNI